MAAYPVVNRHPRIRLRKFEPMKMVHCSMVRLQHWRSFSAKA
jgi:hypothetical protein